MKLLEAIEHYVRISDSPAGIDFNAVFQPDYPVEAWSEMFQSMNLDNERRKSLIKLVGYVLEKPVDTRRELVEELCKPWRRLYVKKNADAALEADETTRQMVISILSTSEENLKNMKQALEGINKNSSK